MPGTPSVTKTENLESATHKEITGQETHNPDASSNDREMIRWTRAVARLTGGLVFVGVVTVLVLIVHARIFVVADETQRAAQRAFVYFSSFNFTPVVGSNGRATAWRMTPFWLNSGNTPAKFVDVESWCPVGATPTVYQYDKLAKQGNGRSIGPKQTIQGIICQITSEALGAVQRGEWQIYLTARATYHDAFDPDYEHVTEVCFQMTDFLGDMGDPANRSSYMVSDGAAGCKFHNCSDEECKQQK